MVSVDFMNLDELMKIMQKVDTVFNMTTPFEAGLEAEVKQGKTMANAAEKAGVGHFIFNSVADADRSTGIPHFDSKYEVEKHIATLKLNYSIVGPSYFMDNLLYFNMDGLKEGKLSMAMPQNVKLQQIAVEDIGKFVGMVVNDGEKMFGKRFNISVDELSGDEAAKVLSRVTGKEIRYEGFGLDFVRQQSKDLAIMYEWFISHGYTADMAQMKTHGFSSFEQWASKQDWSALR